MTYDTRESDYGWRVDYCTRCHQERTCECVHHESAGVVHERSPEAIADCDVCYEQQQGSEALGQVARNVLKGVVR